MSKLSPEDKERIQKKWGEITVPKGETARAKQVRKNALFYQKRQLNELEEGLKITPSDFDPMRLTRERK